MDIAFSHEEVNAEDDEGIAKSDQSENEEVEFDKSKPPVLQDCFAKTKAALIALANGVGETAHMMGPEFFGDALPMSKLRECMNIYPGLNGGYVGYGDYTVGSIFCYLGRGTHPASGEDVKGIEFEDARRKLRRLIVPCSLIARGGPDFFGMLSANGFRIGTEPKAKALTQALFNEVSGPEIDIRDRLGWVRDGKQLIFATPTEMIGATDSTRIVMVNDLAAHTKIGQRGTLEDWQHGVARRCRGNPRLIAMLCTALSGPLLRFASVQPTILHLFGESTTGKTSGLFAAGSVWAGGDDSLGPAHSWNATANSLLATASAYSGTALCLDELRVAKDPLDLAYTLSSGQGRGRLDKLSNQRHVAKFETPIISTGEESFDELARQNKKAMFAGASDVRFPSIPAEPMFEEHHEFAGKKDGAARFADALKIAACESFGHAGPAFVEKLIVYINKIGETEFRKELTADIRSFVDGLDLEDKADDAVRRLARSFGLIAAAGQLASDFDIVPIPPEEIAAGVRRCFADWLISRGGARSKTSATALIGLRDFIFKNMGRFVLATEASSTTVSSLAGYRADNVFYVTPGSWREVMASAPRAKLFEELERLGLLIRQQSAKGNQVVKKLPGGMCIKAYAISARILEVGDDGRLPDDDAAAEHADDKIVHMASAARTLRKTAR